MPTLETVKQQIGAIDGASRLFGRKEIKELPSILWEDEGVEKLVQGFYNGGQGILVATNKRLVFVDKGMLYGLRVEDFPYDKITSVQYETGLFLGKISIFASGNRANIEQVEKGQVRGFAEYVRARISAPTAHASAPRAAAEQPPAPAPPAFMLPNGDLITASAPKAPAAPVPPAFPPNNDLITQLERLAQLKQQGLLTEEEFVAGKQKLLAS